MAESGDLPPMDDRVDTPVDDHDDDLIGFASPASLQGRRREPEPLPEPEPEPDADLFDAPEPEPVEPEPPVEAGAISPRPDSSRPANSPVPRGQPCPAAA